MNKNNFDNPRFGRLDCDCIEMHQFSHTKSAKHLQQGSRMLHKIKIVITSLKILLENNCNSNQLRLMSFKNGTLRRQILDSRFLRFAAGVIGSVDASLCFVSENSSGEVWTSQSGWSGFAKE
jgi:hypothetical protein